MKFINVFIPVLTAFVCWSVLTFFADIAVSPRMMNDTVLKNFGLIMTPLLVSSQVILIIVSMTELKEIYYEYFYRRDLQKQLRKEFYRLCKKKRLTPPSLSFRRKGSSYNLIEEEVNIDIKQCEEEFGFDPFVVLAHEIRHVWQHQSEKLNFELTISLKEAEPNLSYIWRGRLFDLNSVAWKDRPWEIDAMRFETRYATKHDLRTRKCP